jgi:hypothetical protein
LLQSADARILVTDAGGDRLRLTATDGRTPTALADGVTARRDGLGYRLLDARRRSLTLSRSGLAWTPAREGCDQIFRFDQHPMLAPARRVLIVGSRGHPAFPAASIHANFDAAISSARPGDLILLSDGRHQGPLRIAANQGGADGAWVTIASLTPFGAEITANTQEAALAINGAKYVEVRGVRITNRGVGDCIGVRGGAHVRIISNIARDCGGGGIATMQSDFIRIEGNIAIRNAFFSPWQNSGISIYQPQAMGSGPALRQLILNNISALNDNHAPAPGQQYATDGNGIIVDDGRNTQNGSQAGPYRFLTLVENNLVFGNGGSGVRVFESDRVTVRRNTSYWNDNTRSPRQQERSELAAMNCKDCRFERNVAIAGPFPGDPAAVFVYGDAAGGLWVDNVLATAGEAEGKTRLLDAAPTPQFSGNIRNIAPMFRAPSLSLRADFTLTGPAALQQNGYGVDLRRLPPLELVQ